MRRAVVDQPGFRIIVAGLVLSFILGLALRSQISETRIQGYLNKAISRLQNDFYIDFESARVNLSSWGLPLPALVVQNIRLSPKNLLCQNSQIFIKELEVPLSIKAILGFSNILPKVRINEVELRLSDIDKCIDPVKSFETGQEEALKTSSFEPLTQVTPGTVHESHLKNIFSNNTKAELKEIYIEKLKIISSQNTAQPLFLKQLSLELFYSKNKLSEVQIKSKLNALKDARSEVYFLSSNLVAFIKTKENSEIEYTFNINGKLLDGDIGFFAHSQTGSEKVSYVLNLDHVSARALAPIINTLNSDIDKSDTSDKKTSSELQKNLDRYLNFEKAPVSISLSNSGNIFFSKKTKFNSKFNNIQIQIENGILKTGEVDFDIIESKIFIKPFNLKIESLPLSKLKTIGSFKNKLDSFESLGTISGLFEYTNESLYKLKGEIKNIQVVFSNRGRRDLQNVENVGFEIIRKGSELQLTATDFIINKEKAEGEFHSRYNVVNFDTLAQFKLSDIKLNHKIWEQFTFVEQSPRIDILWNFKKLNHETHNIKIYVEEMSLPGINLTGLNVDINQVFSNIPQENKLNVVIKPNKFVGDHFFLNHEMVSQVISQKYGFNLNEFISNRTSMVLSGQDWKNVDFNLDSYYMGDSSLKTDTHLSLKGVTKYQKGLEAQLLLKNRKSSFKFELIRNANDEFIIQKIEQK